MEGAFRDHLPMPPKPVAIVGIATDLPSGHYADANLDHKEFFKFLINKGESYEVVPSERFNLSSWQGKALGQVNTALGSFLKDVGMFDNLEFGITSKDARAMALSTRKLLELSFLSLLDAGIDYRGRNVGCYMSGVAFDIMSVADPDEFEARGAFAGIPCMIANRVSYHLDLLGPSLPIDTACSSSLTAMHLAVQALRSGDCESAVVGGCQLNHRLVDFIQYSQGSVLAQDGKCKPFDAAADGFSRGEGAVVVVLKLLEEAIRDGDHIYASILGTGINSSGSAAPVSAPVADAQADAMRRAYNGIGRSPTEVDFIELHATGTAAGDPTEANWVGAEFQRNDELVIGSVKGNVGHLEITAFLASLSKVCSMIQTGVIPPTVNFRTPNPSIKWRQYNLRVPTEPEPLRARSSSGRPLISMSSSGIGGANGHVVLEGPPIKPKTCNGIVHTDSPTLFIAGGLTPRSTSVVSESISELVRKDDEDLVKWSTLYGRRARQMTWRMFAISIPGRTELSFTQPVLSPRNKGPIVFLFSGQGPQHINMGRQLFKMFPVFRQSIQEMDDVYRSCMGHSLIEKTGLFDNIERPMEKLPSVWPIWAILPSLAIVQMALFDLLCSIGVRPDIVLGHSAGETAMMYASGAASKAMVVELAIARGKAMSIAEEAGGTMAALSCGPKEAQKFIDIATEGEPHGKLEIACFNTQEAVAIAGLETYIDKAIELAEAEGILGRKIRTRVPVHSSVMEVCREEYQRLVNEVFARYPGAHLPKVATYSTLTGSLFTGPFTANYMWENTRYPVLFTQAVTTILSEAPTASFIEISPHPALSSYLSALGAATSNITCPMRRSKKVAEYDEPKYFLESLGRLVMMGYNTVDFMTLNNQHDNQNSLDTPPYPFAKRFIPYYPENSAMVARQTHPRNGPLNYPDLRINTLTHPALAQHVIKGEPIMPAAGYIEMALEFGARTLWKVEFRSMLSLSNDKPLPVEVDLEGLHWTVKSRALTSGRNDVSRLTKANRLHADGYLSRDIPSQNYPNLDIAAILSRCEEFSLEGFYQSLESFAEYGPVFRRLTQCHRVGDEVLVKVRGIDHDLPDAHRYIIHPAIVDACIHVMVHPAFTANANTSIYYLPSRVDLVIIHDILHENGFPSTAFGYAIFRQWLPDSLTFDFIITNEAGERLCTMQNFAVAMHRHSILPQITDRFDLIYQPFAVEKHATIDISTSGSHVSISELYGSMIQHSVKQTGIPDKYYTLGSKEMKLGNGDVNPELNIEAEIGVADKAALVASLRACTTCITDCVRAIQANLLHLRNSGKQVVKILEIGSEHGRLLEHATDVLHKFDDLTIVYFTAAESLEAAQRAAGTKARPIVFDSTVPSEHQLPLSSFDMILGLHALAHIYTPVDVMKALNGLLLPGGSLLMFELERTIAGSAAGVSLQRDLWPSITSKTMSWQDILDEADFKSTQTQLLSTGDPLSTLIMVQKSPLPPLPIEHSEPDNGLWILNYIQGYEMYIRSELAEQNDAIPLTLWLTAVEGTDGDAAVGLVRCLRREFLAWRIFLVIFNGKWSDYEQTLFINNLATVEGLETEIQIDEAGHVLVPRYISRPSPVLKTSFDPTAFWITEDGTHISVVPSPVVPAGHLLLSVDAMSAWKDGIHGVAGYVTDAGKTSLQVGSKVVALSTGPLSNFAVVAEGSIAILPENQSLEQAANLAVAVVSCACAFGLKSLENPSRLRCRRIIIIDDHTSIGEGILSICHGLGLQATRVLPSAAAADFLELRVEATDIICLERRTQLLDSFFSPSTAIFEWSSISRILQNDPWTVGDALQIGFRNIEHASFASDTALHPHSHLAVQPQTVGDVSLFSPTKAYVLVGGNGSLGLQIALWMYQHGAKHIILTSRSGKQSLVRAANVAALRILSYLESMSDLSLRLEASDASSAEAMTALFESIQEPLGGCMLLSGLISDHSFLSQTEESFEYVLAPKKGAFEALEIALPNIEAMDFLITFSSVATFGNAGQTNYASANTLIDGMTCKYRNAFSLIAPAVLDTTFVMGRPDYGTHGSRLGHLLPWGYTSEQVCQCLEDGIRRLANGPFGLYIPAFDWDMVQLHMGPSPLYDHLAKGAEMISSVSVEKVDVSLKDLVLQHLDVSADDFSADIPFTTYGLDSLSAARLSYALRPFIAITQLQLLADLNLNDLESRIESYQAKLAAEEKNVEPEEPKGKEFDWQDMHKPGQTVVKLTDYPETVPLILVHGAGGNIVAFKPLQERFKTSLWAIQTTPETPKSSVQAIATFYCAEIKKSRPEGPYRLGGFSGSNLIAMAMAQRLEAEGNEVSQVLFLDHAPLLFASCLYEMDDQTVKEKKPSRQLLQKTIIGIAGTYFRDGNHTRRGIGEELQEAIDGGSVRPYIQEYFNNTETMLQMYVDFLLDLAALQDAEQKDTSKVEASLINWCKQLKAPVCVVVASRGIIGTGACLCGSAEIQQAHLTQWRDLGASRAFGERAKVIHIEGGHYDMFESDALVKGLEHDWLAL